MLTFFACRTGAIFWMCYGAFKSCRIHRIYELNAHERHHKVVIMSGKLEIFFKPRVSELGGVSVRVGGRVSESWGRVSESWGRVSEKTCRMQWM